MRALTAKHFLFRHRPTHSVCNDPDNEYYKSEDIDIRPHAQRAIEVEGRRVAQFDVRPGLGEARVTRVSDPL